MKKTLAAAAAVLCLVAVSGCAKLAEPYNDAPRTGAQNTGPADVITMPDGFSNLATKCDNGNRIYVVYHGSGEYAAITAVPADPTCAATR